MSILSEDCGIHTPVEIVYEDGDEFVHTDDHPFCGEMPCLCHEDVEALARLNSLIEQGLMTPAEADAVYHGQRSL